MDLRYAKSAIPVLFENDFCLVLDKPAGLAVQGGEGVKVSLDSLLGEKMSPKPLLVHRLDRETSGVILVAKTREAAARFSSLFMEKTRACNSPGKYGSEKEMAMTVKSSGIARQYLGLCFGIPENKEGIIKEKLGARNGKIGNPAKQAETSYRLLSSGSIKIAGDSEQLSFSLLELELGTGRMHQIRRHLALTGNPILGDGKYGIFSLNKKLRKAVGLGHLLLHSTRMIIPPLPGLIPQGLDISADLPEHFLAFMRHAEPVAAPVATPRGAVDPPARFSGHSIPFLERANGGALRSR